MKQILGIHSNFNQNIFESGHAWITLTHNNITTSYGLWPDNHPKTKDNKDSSDIRIGLEPHAGMANRYYILTDKQYNKFRQLLNNNVEWFYTNNCSSWASMVIARIFDIDIDADDYFGIETPRELGYNINKLEKINPTSIKAPRKIKDLKSSLERKEVKELLK